jgi:hypothetical protein
MHGILAAASSDRANSASVLVSNLPTSIIGLPAYLWGVDGSLIGTQPHMSGLSVRHARIDRASECPGQHPGQAATIAAFGD